jgi:hypothetical protein
LSVERLTDREQQHMRTKAKIEIDADANSFGTSRLPELVAALRQCCRFTRNALVYTSVEAGRTRCGATIQVR